MSSGDSVIYVLDDDPRIREALTALFTAMGRRAEVFADADQYLRYDRPDLPACLILDLQLPGMNGLELQTHLAESEGPPIIVLTGHGDIPTTVRAMRAGAIEFLSKPFDEEELMAAIDTAIAFDRVARVANEELRSLKRRHSLLTPREKGVLPYIVAGLLNKQTAGELGTSEITIRIHRGQIMRKMGAESLADLVRMAAKLKIPLPQTAYTKR